MNLILFFNGWGMNKNILKDVIIPDGFTLIEVGYPYDVEEIDLSKYEDIYYIGWSFGCWYLTEYILENNITSQNIIAINGHSQTIGKYGIAPKMFDLTLNTLTEENLLKFYENMGIEKDYFVPDRDFNSIKEELREFGENYVPMENVFHYAYVGEKDRIIPGAKQIKYWKEQNITPVVTKDEHYPFANKNIFNLIITNIKNS